MTNEQRLQLIEQYARGADEVTDALEGFAPAQLTAHPIPGKWSAAEIVHHLSDSESFAAGRIRKLLAEEHAVIQGYDQDEFARVLRYNERDIAPALDNFRTVRAITTQLIRTLSDEQWQRRGWHTDAGLYTAETWLTIYAVHAHGHAGQIRRLRQALSV